MKCLDWKEKISGYIDGETSSEETRLVEEHLEACETCRALERKMRAVGTAVDRIQTDVSPDFREKLFARMEAEELLPRRRSLFVYSLRWAAVPLAAAAFAVFMLVAPDNRQDSGAPQGGLPRVAQPITPQQAPSAEPGPRSAAVPPAAAPGAGQAVATVSLSPEEREIVAHLEMFEDSAAVEDQGDVDAIEIFEPSAARKG